MQSAAQLAGKIRDAGVVGAGGGGYATADKIVARPYHALIVNAVQSEPLIAKDWAALAQFGEAIVAGARLLMDVLSLPKAVIATREEFASALPALAASAARSRVALARVPDLYPLGYEPLLRREVLGLAADDPAAAGALVINAETIGNLSVAERLGRPVLTKLVTVAGAVRSPVTLNLPIGTPAAACLEFACGTLGNGCVVYENGVLGGRPVDPGSSFVSATTLGYVVLPADHCVPGPVDAGDPIKLQQAKRRAEFRARACDGRPTPMSAACALFDLAVYRRARPAFRNLPAAEWPPVLRLTSGVGDGRIEACVAKGDRVERGTLIARRCAPSGVAIHASACGIVEAVDGQGITLRRVDEDGTHR